MYYLLITIFPIWLERRHSSFLSMSPNFQTLLQNHLNLKNVALNFSRSSRDRLSSPDSITPHHLIAWRWLNVCSPEGPSISNQCVSCASATEPCVLTWLKSWMVQHDGMTGCILAAWGTTREIRCILSLERFSLSLCHYYVCRTASFCKGGECQINECASLWFRSPLFNHWPYLVLHELMAPRIKCNGKSS